MVCGLAYAAWQKSVRLQQPVPTVSLVSLAFVVLTFANPRIPPYDLFCRGDCLDRLLWSCQSIQPVVGAGAGTGNRSHPVVDRELRESAVRVSMVAA